MDTRPARFYAITIHQPWASLIVAGAKPVEWRSWRPPRWIPGKRVAIHASRRPIPRALIPAILATLDQSVLRADLARTILHGHDWPLGAVLGTAIFGSPIPGAEYHPTDPFRAEFAWPIISVERFSEPIRATGSQGFWEFSPREIR